MKKLSDKKFLNRYFQTVYNKLEADSLLFNRRIPNESLKGSENEKVLAEVLRDFLPIRYGVESNVLIIDRNGEVSRQIDIVIYDDSFPRYFKKVYPIETVYAAIEVKTQLTKQQSDIALENEVALRRLEFYPLLVPYWEKKTKEQKIPHLPPIHCIFGYRSETDNFSTFIKWFSRLPTNSGKEKGPYHPPFNHFIACALDKGLIFCRGDGYIHRWLAVAEENDNERNFNATAEEHELRVDPAKTLFLFLETLWTMLEQSPRHPGFDIRSYMDEDLGSLIPFNHEGKIEKS